MWGRALHVQRFTCSAPVKSSAGYLHPDDQSTFDQKSARFCPIALIFDFFIPFVTSADRLRAFAAKTEHTPHSIFLPQVYRPIASIARVPDP